MRILVSDYSGHPFAVQLARALARRGHTSLHVSSQAFQTPKGRLDEHEDDPDGFASVQVQTRETFAKSTFFKRRRQEIETGRLIGEQIEAFRPDIVLSANSPLDTQRILQRAALRQGAGFVFWVQDLYGEAISRILGAKFGPLGRFIGDHYRRLEGRMIRASDHVVVIADDFVDAVERLAGVGRERITVIENWAPLDEIALYPRDNPIAARHLPAAECRIVYSGTLGFKHNPALIAAIAKQVDAQVCVFSEGPASDALRAQAKREGIANLHVARWLPFGDLPAVLAGADILLVILEPDAGVFSVPSKVLTYLCVGRPILGAIPRVNLAAKTVEMHGAGIIVEPHDAGGLIEAATRLREEPSTRHEMGTAARAYAERVFDIEAITTAFETVIATVRKRQEESK